MPGNIIVVAGEQNAGKTAFLLNFVRLNMTRHEMFYYSSEMGASEMRKRLEKDARCVLSDSGTVQEECCIFHVPNVTLRDVTERPETIECGSNVLAGADEETILRCVRAVLAQAPEWDVPSEYLDESVSTTVQKILLGLQPAGCTHNG